MNNKIKGFTSYSCHPAGEHARNIQKVNTKKDEAIILRALKLFNLGDYLNLIQAINIKRKLPPFDCSPLVYTRRLAANLQNSKRLNQFVLVNRLDGWMNWPSLVHRLYQDR